ncbi:hypothetical protein UCRPC4_g04458 [Phaeomoniella chlamydospora]|uniref:Uncharacterized protein n=1 Tax=Phaeomoniella chlamydospora TaxID=158046 RepID=A0A0G2E9T2_PHACM|nr:hypothetical protein UCRPC4_g04458 [Phaeomoniella chlamydospora]
MVSSMSRNTSKDPARHLCSKEGLRTANELENALTEARRYYGKERPEFAVTKRNNQPGTTRTVMVPQKLARGNQGIITYRMWDKLYGFWVLTTSKENQQIVKYDFTGRQGYKAWLGIGNGLSVEPVAYPQTQRALTRGQLEESEFENEEREVEDISSGDQHESARETSEANKGGYHLRKRTSDFAPFTQERLKRRAFRSTSPLPETSYHNNKHPKEMKRQLQKIERATTFSSSSEPEKVTYVRDPNRPTRQEMKRRTKMLVMIGEANLCVPIYFSTCDDIQSLYDKVLQVSDVEKSKVLYIVVRFPWLPQHQPIILRRDLEDCYRMIEEEMEQAPCWLDDNKRCTIQVDVVKRV